MAVEFRTAGNASAPASAATPQVASQFDITVKISNEITNNDLLHSRVFEPFSEKLQLQTRKLCDESKVFTSQEASAVWLAGAELMPNAIHHGILGLESSQTGQLGGGLSAEREAVIAIISARLKSIADANQNPLDGQQPLGVAKFSCATSEDLIVVSISGIGSFPKFNERWEVAKQKALSGNVPFEELIIPNNRGLLILAGYFNDAHYSKDTLTFTRNRKFPPVIPDDDFSTMTAPGATS